MKIPQICVLVVGIRPDHEERIRCVKVKSLPSYPIQEVKNGRDKKVNEEHLINEENKILGLINKVLMENGYNCFI